MEHTFWRFGPANGHKMRSAASDSAIVAKYAALSLAHSLPSLSLAHTLGVVL